MHHLIGIVFLNHLFYYSSGDDVRSRCNPRVKIDLKDWRNPSSNRHIFLKLHGAINWWFDGANINYLSYSANGPLNDQWESYERFENIGEPVILEPSYHKYDSPAYMILKDQWRYFIESMVNADVAIIIGYSLPEADALARTAFSFGFQSGKPDSKWIVVNKSEDCCNNYIRLFGEEKIIIYQKGLEQLNNEIDNILEAL